MKHGNGKPSLATETTMASTKPSFDPTSFLIVPPKRFDDLKVGTSFVHPVARLLMHTHRRSTPSRLTIIRCITTRNGQ
jgi:hypothetical protein